MATARRELPERGSPEHLIETAERYDVMRRLEARSSLERCAYLLLSHLPKNGMAEIRRRENAARSYWVNYLTGECDCPDYQDRLRPMNEQLARMGSDKRVCCKHVSLAWVLAWEDAGQDWDGADTGAVLTTAERESDFRQRAEFDARRAGDFGGRAVV